MMPGPSVHTVVVETSVFEVSIDRSDAPRAMSVELTRNGIRVRGWEEPGWRDLGIGASQGRFYWWSARRLVVVGVDSELVLEAVTDEDVLVVFASSSHWVLACESSILVIADGERRSKLELDDTIEACTFDGSKLYARLSNGNKRTAEVSSDGLRLV